MTRTGLAVSVVVLVVLVGVAAWITPLVDARAPTAAGPHGDDRVKASSSSVPTLSPDHRTTLQLRVLIFRNAQLELEVLVKDLAVPGFTIDLSTLTYVPIPEAPQ